MTADTFVYEILSAHSCSAPIWKISWCCQNLNSESCNRVHVFFRWIFEREQEYLKRNYKQTETTRTGRFSVIFKPENNEQEAKL